MSGTEQATSGTEPATVLVVDDEPDVADAYAAQLDEDFIVSTAYGGEEALDKIDASVDIVLLDRRMPGTSGDEVLEKIRNRNLNTRVAMVTAVDPDFDIVAMPFDDYIIKPVSREELLETIERLLDIASYEEKMRRYYAISAKVATLKTNKPESELADNEQFQQLTEKQARFREELDDTVSEFGKDEMEKALEDLTRSTPDHFE
jgi:DNA-binding response OmpR family regulator